MRPDWIKPGATRSDLRAAPAVSRSVCRISPKALMQDHPDTDCIVLHSLGDTKPGVKAREKPHPHFLADPAATAKTKPKGLGTENGCKMQNAVGTEPKGIYTAMTWLFRMGWLRPFSLRWKSIPVQLFSWLWVLSTAAPAALEVHKPSCFLTGVCAALCRGAVKTVTRYNIMEQDTCHPRD